MAENPMIELAQTVMIEKYGLDEETYGLVKYAEGSKNVTIGMSDGVIPLTASFPVIILKMEEMIRWEYSKKEMFVRNMILNGTELPEELAKDFEFNNLYIKHSMGAINPIAEKQSLEIVEKTKDFTEEDAMEVFDAVDEVQEEVEKPKRKKLLKK